jgi:hypothetical protein
MANHCFNTVSFFGNDAVLKQVEAWNTALSSFAPTEEDPYCMRAIRPVFYPDKASDKDIDMGSKWVHEDLVSTGAGDGELGLQSAWNSPDLLLEHLACTLYKVDQNVVIENIFNIEDGTVGFRYLTPLSETKAYVQRFECETDYESHEEPEDAEAEAEELYDEHKLEYLTDLLMDNPNTIDVVQKFMPDFPVDWKQLKIDALRVDDE